MPNASLFPASVGWEIIAASVKRSKHNPGSLFLRTVEDFTNRETGM